jgi:hypothetical protein
MVGRTGDGSGPIGLLLRTRSTRRGMAFRSPGQTRQGLKSIDLFRDGGTKYLHAQLLHPKHDPLNQRAQGSSPCAPDQ